MSKKNLDSSAAGKPEWSIFERLEQLEKTLGSVRDLTLKDMYSLTSYTLMFSFASWATRFPRNARRTKDLIISDLKKRGINKEVVDSIENMLISVCEIAEKNL